LQPKSKQKDMKKILVVIISLFAMLPCEGKSVNVIRHSFSHRGMAHAPSVVGVGANYDNDKISVCISKYSGISKSQSNIGQYYTQTPLLERKADNRKAVKE